MHRQPECRLIENYLGGCVPEVSFSLFQRGATE